MIEDLTRAWMRALASMAHPRVLWLMLAPFAVTALIWGTVAWFTWQPTMAALRSWLDGWAPATLLAETLVRFGLDGALPLLALLLLIALLVFAAVATLLMYVALWTMPAAISYMSARHYPSLEARHGGTQLGSLRNALGALLMFALLGLISLPLWLMPLLFVVLSPLLWGWLTYRVMRYDALMIHADASEREILFKSRRLPLWLMGIATGMLSMAPAWIWAASILSVVLFPLLLLLSLWLHVAIFLFSSLWFGHYCLDALQRLRGERERSMTETA